MKHAVLVLVAVAVVAVGGSQAAAQESFPELIRLPDGFQPEGIAISGNTFYVGSIPTGAIYRGDLRTGLGGVLFAGGPGRASIGVAVDRPAANPFDPGRLVVAGGPTGKAFVYSARDGRPLATYDLTTLPTFVNDVVVTDEAAWLTDSLNQVVYRIGFGLRRGQASVTTVPLTGDISYIAGFNVNGIDATPDGETLVLVQSNTGKLFTSTTAGVTREIDLGGATVTNGDGILLDGRTLYVVQNRNNRIAVVTLSDDMQSGTITRFITDPDFDVPTTVDDLGDRLYLPNARFGTPSPSTARFDVVQVSK
jgi:sugar lactone lactonase YvrE